LSRQADPFASPLPAILQSPFFLKIRVNRRGPGKRAAGEVYRFVTDGRESAIRQAKTIAGNKEVTIIGSASTTAECLTAGLEDDLYIDIIPVFLHAGFRPFEMSGNSSITLVRTKVIGLPAGRTQMRLRIEK
jgi:dihydrofolate reductase